jgi:hypothetical protein
MRKASAIPAAIMLITLASNLTFSQEGIWKYVTRSVAGMEVYYAPRRTVRRANGIVRTWVRFVEPETEKVEDETIGLYEFDCKEGRYRVLQETKYYRSGSGTTNSRVSSWFYATPGSVTETLSTRVCAH